MRRRIFFFLVILFMCSALAACKGARGESRSSPDAGHTTTSPAPVDPADAWPKEITITLGGDCTIGCTDAQRKLSNGFEAVVEQNGYAWPFSGVVDLFEQDDLTLVNFEGTLTASKNNQDKEINFKGPMDYAEILALGSVEAVNLANNHFSDYGREGRADTMATLSTWGIAYCAPDAPAVYEVRGVKIGLIGNTFRYYQGRRDIRKDVEALREQGCQIVIASFHWGDEYAPYNREQRMIGRAAMDAGADIVVGHHPHVIQGIEAYGGSYILYSLGNLVFGGNMNPKERDAYLAQLTFTVYESGALDGPELTIIPIRTTSLEEGTDYRPVIAQDEAYERILQKILDGPPVYPVNE